MMVCRWDLVGSCLHMLGEALCYELFSLVLRKRMQV